MFWKREDSDSTVPLQEFTSRKKYEALQNIDHPDAGKDSTPDFANACSVAQRRYFKNAVINKSQILTATGKADPEQALVIPKETSVFKLIANYSNYSTGYYKIRWRMKILGNHLSYDLRFAANVSYDLEPDVSGTFEAQLPRHELTDQAKDQWYNIEIEEKLSILPHVGVARIQLALSNNDGQDQVENSGIIIDFAEITPLYFNLDHQESGPLPFDPTKIPITRLSASIGSCFLASLAVSKDIAIVTVWDVNSTKAITKPRSGGVAPGKRAAIAIIKHVGIENLSIGISLSASGDQVAVYQEPKIGEWIDGSQVQEATFPFTIYNNPLIPHANLILDLDESSGDTELAVTGILPIDSVILQRVAWKDDVLSNFIGFGTFLPETRKGDWEKNDLNDALFDDDDDDDTHKGIHRGESNESMGNDQSNSSDSRSMFVACNGIYLDVFEISSDNVWSRLHTITLKDLTPTLTRRITCKLMVDSVSSNTFMWLEDSGICCTIWNIMNGSSISYISSTENSRFKGPTFRGHTKMAISPRESIVAIASIDGRLTTYFANTGMAIDDRQFSDHKIEYVGFHGEENEVIVILKNNTTSQLSTRIVDSYQLKCESIVNDIPIPTIGSTALCFFSGKGVWKRGLVCEPDGVGIGFYYTQNRASPKVNKSSPTVIKAFERSDKHESLIDETITYYLRTGFHRERLPDSEGMSYWVLRVELIEENETNGAKKIIFSFIPEPWMRSKTSDNVDPKDLIKAYFLPGGTRFAVVGVQTLQIWNLPSRVDPKCSLEYVWSQPKASENSHEIFAHQSRNVQDYYYDITRVDIFMDAETSNTMAEVKTSLSSKKILVYIPEKDSESPRRTVVSCFQGIHLLANAYAFSRNESMKSAREVPQVTLTFEDHAEAIVRFARGYINRMLSQKLYSPKVKGEGSRKNNPQVKSDKNGGPEVVTLLTVLLDETHFKVANHAFVEGLLLNGDGEWIPRDKKALNPIKRAIDSKDAQLVQVFVDYCIKNAKKYHPAYLTPAIQCLNELSDRYPTILADMFRRASYVPAHNYAYAGSHAIVANRKYGDYFNFLANYYSFRLWRGTWFTKSHNINDYQNPVFSLRSQLPIRAVRSYNVLSIETAVIERRVDIFPAKREEEDEEQKRIQSKFSHKIYVCPFPKLSYFGPYRTWLDNTSKRSAFTDIAGQEFFDSPAMVATLKFKWQVRSMFLLIRHKYGFFNWALRFAITVSFFIFMTIITGMQIQTATLPRVNTEEVLKNATAGIPVIGLPTEEDIADRYLEGWHIFIKITIATGFFIMLYDVQRFIESPRKYIRSPFNYMHLIAHLFSIVGLFYFLVDRPGPGKDGGPDDGPSQIWALSFGILALYMNMAGRYDPLSTSFEHGAISFHIMMVIYFFFTTVLLLNVLIALMNDAFNESSNQGQLAWLKQWSEVISDVETCYLSNGSRQNRNLFPDYIYYGSSEKEAEIYETKFFISNKSNLSIENRFLIDAVSGEQSAANITQRVIMKDIQSLGTNIQALEKNQQELTQDAAVVKSTVQKSQEDLALDLAEMRKLVSFLVTQAGGTVPERKITTQVPTKPSSTADSPIHASPAETQATNISSAPMSSSRPQDVQSPSTPARLVSDKIELEGNLRTKASLTILKQRLQKQMATESSSDSNDVSNPVYVSSELRQGSNYGEKAEIHDSDGDDDD
ncbi:hypothetical protein BGZ76_006524 [Entomortierella beljakovae]|nr:hypothetical protein BGZ76_006524 [Entomortierella beljakovae]